MLRTIITDYFTEKGLKFKEHNGQFCLEVCPACGDNKFHHVYMHNEEGLWDCKKCGEEGNFNKFRKFYGDDPIQSKDNPMPFAVDGISVPKPAPKVYNSLDNKQAVGNASRLKLKTKTLDYLTKERGFEEKILDQFKIGITTDGRISIPLYEDGKLVNFRYRKNPEDKTDGPKYTQEAGCKSVLFNGDLLKNKAVRNVFLVEGEFDAMQLVQRGLTNTISVTLGATSFKKEWVEKFDHIQKVIICYDNDQAGLDGVAKVSKMLGEERCFSVQLPNTINDIGDYFKGGASKKDFLALVATASTINGVGANDIKHISEYNENLRDRLINGEYFGISTGYDEFDEIMGGLRKERLVIVAGLTNVGKTSFAVNVALNLAEAKRPIFFFSLEMPPIDIAKKILMLKARLTNTELKDIKDPSDELKTVDKTLKSFTPTGEMPIYLYDGSGVVSKNLLADACRQAVRRYGVEAIFVDHLHYFVMNYNNLAADTSRIVREIKMLARELEVPIVLLAHLNRGGRAKQRKGLYIPSLADLKDTGTIEQDADQVIFVCRDSESEDEGDREKSIIKLAKNRDGAAGRSVSMKFDEGINTFIEVNGVNYLQESEDHEEALKSDVVIPELDESTNQTAYPF